LCIISWLAWFLVACVVSKKFIKFLRKSLKEFEKKSCFKRSLKKKKRKKRKQTLLPFRPSPACRPTKPPRSGPPNRLLFFFLADTDTWALPVSLTLSPSFLLPHLAASRPGGTARIPPHPATSLPSLLTNPAN
jgi:hypothetical protein